MPLPERFRAWIVTGPLGHLYATTADVVVLWARWGAQSLAHRLGSR
jgi:hypothetical protein